MRISRSRMWSHQRQTDLTLMNSLFWHNLALVANTAFLTHSWVWPLISSFASSSPYCWQSHLYSHMVNQSRELWSRTILAKLFFSQINSPIWFIGQRYKHYSNIRRKVNGHEGRKLFFHDQKKENRVKATASSQVKIMRFGKSNYKVIIKEWKMVKRWRKM